MSKGRRLLAIIVLLVALSQLFSCRKVDDMHPGGPSDNIKICNIQTINFKYQGSDITATFYYNKYGNPDSVNFTRVGTGNPNIVIRYDAQQRMTDFIQPYTNGLFERWQKFSYDAGNRIVSEKFFAFGLYNGSEPTSYFSSGTTKYEYDVYGRITKAVSQEGSLPESSQEFKYDASGNLVKPGVAYDNRINLHRTNKIWQFIDRDYSRNNPFTATTYNLLGLPVSIPGEQTPPPTFLRRPITAAVIHYLCDAE
jgi:hypothetical protein